MTALLALLRRIMNDFMVFFCSKSIERVGRDISRDRRSLNASGFTIEASIFEPKEHNTGD